ncbi:MAG: ABC transporter permease [Clostridiales bacterium]|nr:ABC transporter permease [Clostridiales bacterium]
MSEHIKKSAHQARSDKNTSGLSDMRRGQGADIWRRLKKSKLTIVSLIFIAILILSAIFADVIAPYDYAAVDLANTLQYPSLKHLMGTDDFGRDIFSRILYGGRISLLVASITVVISIVCAAVLGSIAGYFGGWFDAVIMRLMDIIMSIPGMLLAISIAAALGTGIFNTAIAISISNIPALTRIVRSSVLLLREREYVEAAISFGASHGRIIRKHIIPNTLAPLIVQSTLKFGDAILCIASLSFIGLGIQPPTPEWGSILSNGRELVRSFWPIVTFPGIMIALTMLAFNLAGDGLRDAMDPRLKQ